MNNRVYIAGKMRGMPNCGFPAFDAARDSLIRQGFDVVSPADLDRAAGFDGADYPEGIIPADFDLREVARRDLNAICDCSHIALLHGWEASTGARAELAVAEWLGLSVIHLEQTKTPNM
jgi:hypothetical protein